MTSLFYNEWAANSQVADTLFMQSDWAGGAYAPPLDYMKMHAVTRGSLGAQTVPPAGAYATSLDVAEGGNSGENKGSKSGAAVSPAMLIAVGLVVFYLFSRQA